MVWSKFVHKIQIIKSFADFWNLSLYPLTPNIKKTYPILSPYFSYKSTVEKLQTTRVIISLILMTSGVE